MNNSKKIAISNSKSGIPHDSAPYITSSNLLLRRILRLNDIIILND